MFGYPPIHISSTAAAFPSYLIIPTTKLCSLKFSPCLKSPLGRKRNVFCLKATSSADTDHTQQQPTSSSESKSPLSIVFDVPRIIWRQTLRPLGYFRFGRRSIWEGGVGLFLLSGTVLLTLSLAWLKGFRLRSKFWKYLAVFEFDQASGLLMETMIDITPRNPILTPSVSPLDADCVKEDELVGIFTRIGREVEEIGVANTYSLAERVSSVVEEARPLLIKIKAMAEDIQPLLAEVRNSGLLKEVENLTKSITQASEDLRRVHSSVMTPENTELIQKSIYTLIFTLKNFESISSDLLGFTGDEVTRRNLKLLIKSLSRLL
ncbi:Hypothetical predicted protein [Olea europaea subsp. europaea]|uniref:Uncharacterized protein n=1 Tax=Olea europaea subsp. europaea TaxID=158383 RepID=A0A8S0UMV3_OLEEU|nr:Hypothetical predicted protein [Olea europaea subsp. europaea]